MRRITVLVGGVLVLSLVVFALVLEAAAPAREGWREVAPGVAHRALSLPGGAAGEAFRVDLRRAEIRVVDARTLGGRATARELRERTPGAVLAVNGGFFDETGEPMGLVLSDGQEKNTLRRTDWGVLWVAGDHAGIVHTRTWRDAPRSDARHALQSGPRLVVGGRPVKLKAQVARRTAVCLRSPSDLVLVVTEAVGLRPLAEFLARKPAAGGLGCLDALNLDGGPSTQLSLEAGPRRMDISGGWGVPNGLVVLPRPAKGAAPDGGRPDAAPDQKR